jgi:hypothetical protein
MARWGRATDIEWVYEVRLDAQGTVRAETIQGTRHRIQRFHGKKQADHPLILVASDNNNFSDQGRSQMRLALRPIPFDLSRQSREELMDRNPWTYRIMAEELYREGKIAEPSHIGHSIADPRHYLYLDAASDQGSTALSFDVKLKGDRKWYPSDLGIDYFKIERSGYFRTTIKIPSGTKLEDIERIAVRCDLATDPRSREALNKLSSAACNVKSVNKIFLLDENFQPGPSLPVNVQPLRLQFGEMVELYNGQVNLVVGK